MRKRFLITIIFIVNMVIAVCIGWYIYKINNIDEINNTQIAKNSNVKIQDECTEFSKVYETATMQANANEEKVTPKTKLIIQKNYKGCKHTITDDVELPKEMVNKTKKEIEEYYGNWKLEEFSKSNIILSKEFEGICNEHYILKSENGYVVIYTISEDDNENYLKETQISTQFLSEEDLENLQKGIAIVGNDELQKALEDFE